MTSFVYSAPALIVPLLRVSRALRPSPPKGKARQFDIKPTLVAMVCAFVVEGGSVS